jgi:hypothetical protein
MRITRRLFLRNTAAAGAVGATGAAPAVAEAMTPHERMMRARHELVEATKAAYAEISDWRVMLDEPDSGGIVGMFMMLGHRKRGAGGDRA